MSLDGISDRVLEVLSGPRRTPPRAKDLARALEIPTEDYREFKDVLRKLVKRGRLERVRGNRYALPGPSGPSPAARPRKEDRDKRPEKTHIVGVYRRGRGGGTVTPLDPRVRGKIHVPSGREGDATGGDVVVLRPLRTSRGQRAAAGEVEAVLGKSGDPGVDVLAVLHAYGLPDAFPPSVEAAAREAAGRMTTPGHRVDRRSLHVFTIDPADAKDHDDALSVSDAGSGTWEVGIHIADVSHFVTEGSPLDREALGRGTSVYLVDQVVPMLPHTLSSDLCSLREREDRMALSIFLRMDSEGSVRTHRFERTWIRCRCRLSYDRAQEVLVGPGSVDAPTDEALRTLDRLAKALRVRRRARGSLDFDLPEARVVLDDEGMPIDILKVEQLDSHRLIEDFMILANELVAGEAEKRGLHITYRVHDSPAPDRADTLREFLQPLGYSLPRGSPGPTAYQRILDRAEGRPEQGLVSTVVLRAMARARYDAQNAGHFGLASQSYAHFTSPIRRYPDLALHRVVSRCLIDGEPPPKHWSHDFMAEVAEIASERERVAQQAERDSVEMKKVEFMARHLGDEFEGTISGVTSFGLFVLLDRYFVEGLIHIGALGDDYYVFLAEEFALAGQRTKRRFQLGDRVVVQVVRTDKEGRRIDFLLVDNPSVSPPRGRGIRSGDSPVPKRRKRV